MWTVRILTTYNPNEWRYWPAAMGIEAAREMRRSLLLCSLVLIARVVRYR